MYVYRKTYPIPGLCEEIYQVGSFSASGEWCVESKFADREDAARRVHFLNGGDEVRGDNHGV